MSRPHPTLPPQAAQGTTSLLVVLRRLRGRLMSRRGEPLSDRQAEVMRLVAEGMTSKAIASVLGLAPGTVKQHLTQCYRRLDAIDRVTAALAAQRLGYVPLPTTVGSDSETFA